jgi:hypothetical protein
LHRNGLDRRLFAPLEANKNPPRELLERLAIIELGMAALRETQRRNADPEEVVLEEAVQAVHEARAEMQ